VREDLPRLLERIRVLADADATEPADRLLATIEHTLTDGYAHALALEGERLRLERQVSETVPYVADEGRRDALTSLAARLQATDRDLGRLRAALRRLDRRADLVRRTAATAAR
jgi:hypothetical protein